jgi:uncharacterized protein
MRRQPAWRLGVALAVVMGATTLPVAADLGPYTGGPTHYFTTSDGTEIALSVMFPDGFDPDDTYPAILEMAGYENASASPDGRTMLGQTKDFACAESPDPAWCPDEDPPLADDSHTGTSAFRYRDAYVVVHANLPGTGCSSGEFSLYDLEHARAGYELIEDWIVHQPWSNGQVGLLGHSFGGITAMLIAAHQPPHLTAMTVSGLVDDLYRGITFPGGVLNTLFPPLWYLGIRPAFHVAGGSGQGIVRNADNDRGHRCASNTATHTESVENNPFVNGVQSQGLDSEYWRRVSLITYVDRIDVPIHIAGTWQDEQTGARGFTHLWEKITPGVPKRLVVSNGDHDANVLPYELWADRKAWMDYWMRGVPPDPTWGWSQTTEDGTFIRDASVRTLFELHPDAEGDLVSGGYLDGTGYPIDGTRWTDYYLCDGNALTPDRTACGQGSDTYLSGTGRQSWLFQAGADGGPPATTADGPDQLIFAAPVVEEGETWAIAGPIMAHLLLSATGNDTDLFVQIAAEDMATGALTFLQRGWLKASHRTIDAERSDYSDVDPDRPGFLYRPFRPHTSTTSVPFSEPLEYLVEVWPTAHVFRPGQRLVVIVTAPPAIDSNYSFAVPTSQPASANTLFYNDAASPSRITLPVVPAEEITDLAAEGPGCGAYWGVRCASSTP